jgi:YD repeat-containing protein
MSVSAIVPTRSYSYDLIGEQSSSTPPNGYNGSSCATFLSPNSYTTTIGRNPSLTKTTVTDPRGYTTVADLDGQGRKTDYTDKRGVETTYTYNKFGEVTQAYFNENDKSGFSQEQVNMSNYDLLLSSGGSPRIQSVQPVTPSQHRGTTKSHRSSVILPTVVIPLCHNAYMTGHPFLPSHLPKGICLLPIRAHHSQHFHSL